MQSSSDKPNNCYAALISKLFKVVTIKCMGWLRSVGSIKLQVSFAEYRLFYRALLQKRPIILSILLTKATPQQIQEDFPERGKYASVARSLSFWHMCCMRICKLSAFLILFQKSQICTDTGWRRLIGSPKLQIIFHKRATKYRLLLRKMTCKDKGSYESSPPCIWSIQHFTSISDLHCYMKVQCQMGSLDLRRHMEVQWQMGSPVRYIDRAPQLDLWMEPIYHCTSAHLPLHLHI